MKYKRDFFENLAAEVVARLIIGSFGALLAVLAIRWYFFRLLWDTVGWKVLLVPAAVGVVYAMFGVRKGPGAI